MGGLAGRSDGLCGAVECQKLTGSLHLHFWNYVQRAHQHKTLEEIAGMLSEALIHADDLKNFCENLCQESYPDEKAHNNNIDQVERHWPRFHERDANPTNNTPTWEQHRVGNDTRLQPADCSQKRLPSLVTIEFGV